MDHVLAATGYRVDLSRLDFLSPELCGKVRCLAGWPDLSTSFQSSVPGLYFTNQLASRPFFLSGGMAATLALISDTIGRGARYREIQEFFAE